MYFLFLFTLTPATLLLRIIVSPLLHQIFFADTNYKAVIATHAVMNGQGNQGPYCNRKNCSLLGSCHRNKLIFFYVSSEHKGVDHQL